MPEKQRDKRNFETYVQPKDNGDNAIEIFKALEINDCDEMSEEPKNEHYFETYTQPKDEYRRKSVSKIDGAKPRQNVASRICRTTARKPVFRSDGLADRGRAAAEDDRQDFAHRVPLLDRDGGRQGAEVLPGRAPRPPP